MHWLWVWCFAVCDVVGYVMWCLVAEHSNVISILISSEFLKMETLVSVVRGDNVLGNVVSVLWAGWPLSYSAWCMMAVSSFVFVYTLPRQALMRQTFVILRKDLVNFNGFLCLEKMINNQIVVIIIQKLVWAVCRKHVDLSHQKLFIQLLNGLQGFDYHCVLWIWRLRSVSSIVTNIWVPS